ncbi:MAG: ATP-binding protein, partial [Chitinophagaceae bacterium]
KLMIFRIIQEQVNNIVRHAEASLIQIKLESDAESIILGITDNGKGFDPAHTKKGQGFSNISNRAALFNASVEIDSTPGNGCRLSVIIPVEVTGEDNELM